MKVSNVHRLDSTRLLKSVSEKLHPKRFPKMSDRMAAVVAFLINQQVTRPTIVEIVVTSDRFVLAGLDDEVGANHLIGTYSDLVRNWHVAALMAKSRNAWRGTLMPVRICFINVLLYGQLKPLSTTRIRAKSGVSETVVYATFL